MTSTTNTAGLEVVAWAERGPESGELCEVRLIDALTDEEREAGWLSEPLVTAASAQARIDAAEARADRLAGALEEAHSYLEVLHSVTANATTKSSVWKVIKRARAALQQEPTT